MAPPIVKRRRPNDQSDSDGLRPSPHRPEQLAMSRQNNNYSQEPQYRQSPSYHHSQGPPPQRGRGDGRRPVRGGHRSRGGYYQHSPAEYTTESHPAQLPEPSNNLLGAQSQRSRPSSSSAASAPSAPSTQQQAPQPLPSTATPNDTQPSKPVEPETREPVPHDFEIVTDDCVATWTQDGRATILRQLTAAIAEEDFLRTSDLYQELLYSALHRRIDATDAGAVINEALTAAAGSALDGPEVFLDLISLICESDTTDPNLKSLLVATGISPDLMRRNLEANMLASLGLVRNTFMRMFSRKQTNILYRQSNFNLLREESEGFSKLVTELYDISTSKDLPPNVAEETFEKILALIGSFNLDAGRVLDVTLDLFANLLVKHFRFFVKYLRASQYWPKERLPGIESVDYPSLDILPAWALPGSTSWITSDEEKIRLTPLRAERDARFWNRAREIGIDAFFELGGRQVLDADAVLAHTMANESGDEFRSLETRQWITQTKTLPPIGNAVAAQLLGFKLRFYSSTNRDATDVLPDNLIYLAAMLIKIGFISLRDLYTHLYPEDTSMEAVKEKKQRELDERDEAKRGGGTANALSRASALVDDTIPAPAARIRDADKPGASPKPDSGTVAAAEVTEAEILPEPADQKIELLKSLLCIGAIPESLYLLGRFPWLFDLVPDLPDHLNRIFHHQISGVYTSLRPLSDRASLKNNLDTDDLPPPGFGGLSAEYKRQIDSTPRKVLKWAKLDANGVDGANDYRFYWEEALDSIPVCQTVDDVFTLCKTLLSFAGVKIGQDPLLLGKLLRIARHSLGQDFSEANQARWIDLLKRLLCPAISLTHANTSLALQLYDILLLFPLAVRYSVYAEWFQGQAARIPDVRQVFKDCERQSKSLIKRTTTKNSKMMGRALAKIATSCPSIVFSTVFAQIEAYANQGIAFVSCARYFDPLAYDVLIWSIISQLGQKGRSKMKSSGIEIADWFGNLSDFIGRLFRDYDRLDCLPVLQYLLHRLQRGDFVELRVLKQMIVHMAGIIPEVNLSDFQTKCLAGGPKLRAYTFFKIHDKRHESKKSMERLVRCLAQNHIAGSFLVAIAQNRQRVMNSANDESSPKVISENFDDVHETLGQFLELLNANIPADELARCLPDVPSLMVDYGLDLPIAFSVHRRIVTHAIRIYDDEHSNGANAKKTSTNATASDQDVMMEDANAETSAESVGVNSELGTNATQSNVAGTAGHDSMACHPVLKQISERLVVLLGEQLHATINMDFLATFWALNPSELFFDGQSYEDVIRQSKERFDEIGREISRLPVPLADAESKDRKARLEAERQWLADIRPRLKPEKERGLADFNRTHSRMTTEKNLWFKDVHCGFKQLHEGLWQTCFLPRMLLSPLDAYFCWTMLWFLHTEATPGFSTMHFINVLFDQVTLQNVIFQCTSREIENLGRFVCQVLAKLASWHGNEKLYEKEALGPNLELRGFARKITDGKPDKLVTFKEFRQLHLTWHKAISAAIIACIQPQGELTHIKNAISFVKSIADYWPRLDSLGQKMVKLSQELAEDEQVSTKDKPAYGLERPDLAVALISLQATLQKSRPKWQGQTDHAFLTGEQPKKIPPPSNGRSTPTPVRSHVPKLNAEAPSFASRPSARADRETASVRATNGVRKVAIPSKAEVEDGELADSPVVSKEPVTDSHKRPSAEEVQQSKQKALANMPKRDHDSAQSPPVPPAADRIDENHRASAAASRMSNNFSSEPDSRAPTPRQEAKERRAPLPAPRPPTGPPERFESSSHGRPPLSSTPSGRPTHEPRVESRMRMPDGGGRLERPQDLMSDRGRSTAPPGRLAGSQHERGAAAPHEGYYDGARGGERVPRPFPDDRARPLMRESGRREALREPPHGNERTFRYDDPRREGSGRLSPRDGRGMPPPGGNNAPANATVDPARAMMIDGASGTPHREPLHASSRGGQPRSRQPTPPEERIRIQREQREQQHARQASGVERYENARAPFDPSYDRGSDYGVPNGPRAGERPSRGGYDEVSRNGAPPRAGPDVGGHARFSDGARYAQDPNYGRLQREPTSPTGPRSTVGRGPAGPERSRAGGPPVGDVASPHAPPRRASDRYQQPGTPSTPDTSTGVHPSRLGQIEADGSVRGQAGPLSHAPPPPMGPRGVQTPTQASPMNAPTGPAAAPAGPSSDRRRADSRQFQGLQDHLQGGGRVRDAARDTRGGAAANGFAEYNSRGSMMTGAQQQASPLQGPLGPGAAGEMREAYGERRGPPRPDDGRARRSGRDGAAPNMRGPMAAERDFRDSVGSNGGGRDLMEEDGRRRGVEGSLGSRKRDFPSEGYAEQGRGGEKRSRHGP